MPKVIYPIPGVKDSVQRPVGFDIIRQVMEWTGLPKSTQIRFPGETEKMKQPGSTISEEDFNSFNTDPQWTVTIEEETQLDRVLSTAVVYDDNPHIYWDGDIRVYIRPAYTPVDLVINISGRFNDKESAFKWRDEIRNRVSTNRDVRIHDLTYSYLIPPECMYTLKEIHRLREAVAPYNEDFDTYFQNHVTKKASVLTNMAGNSPSWGISETQARVVGWFEFEGEPEKGEKDPEHSAWDINFTYRIKYDRPSTCLIEYPLMIHNQLISSKFRPTAPTPTFGDHQLNYSISARALASFESSRLSFPQGLPGICIPDFDEFLPASIPPDSLRLITALTSIDINNPFDLMDLNDLDEYKFTPELLEFMRSEYQYIHIPGQSVINVSVYRFENMMHSNNFAVTPDLIVRLVNVPSLRDVFHVRVGICRNPKLLSPTAKDRLRNNYVAARQILTALSPKLEATNAFGISLPGNVMTRKDFSAALEHLDDEFTLQKSNTIYQHNTVMSLFVNAGRRN